MLKELGKTFLQQLKIILQYKYFWLIFFLLIMIISYGRIGIETKSKYSSEEKEFELVVLEKKYQNDKYVITFKGKEKIISRMEEFPYDIGDIVNVKGSLEKVSNNTIPNLFNYQKYLQSREIYWQLKINEIFLVKKNNNLWNSIKKEILSRIDRIEHKEYLYAFLLGDTSFFSEEVKTKYQINGLSYILAIGSLQIMMILKGLEKIEKKIKIKKGLKIFINILIIIFYFRITNYVIGVLRSGICYIIKSLLNYKKIKYKYYNIILLIGIILMIINPNYINNVGFLYSFFISLGISILNKKIKGIYLKRLFQISFIAFTIGLPITIYSNYEINFLSVFFSFFIVPIFTFLVFPLCIIVFIFPFINFIFNFVISFIEYIINFFLNISFLTFIMKKPSMFIIIIYYLVIALFFMNKKNLIFFILLLFFHHNINSIAKEDLITFLDVKEGDCILVKSNNKVVLIDTGGSTYTEYSDEIIKYIKSLGVSKIDKMFLTHGDMDHLGSSYKLVDKIKIDYVYFNVNEYNYNEKELINLLDIKKIPYQKIGTFFYKLNNYTIKIKSYNLNTENDSSMMISIKNGGFKMLLMGDATINSEKKLMSEYDLSKYDVLKIGHHGSKTSTGQNFYNKINPDISIISVGNTNIYHLPNYEILERINDSKAFLTSKSGSITLKFSNKKIFLEECPP